LNIITKNYINIILLKFKKLLNKIYILWKDKYTKYIYIYIIKTTFWILFNIIIFFFFFFFFEFTENLNKKKLKINKIK